MADKEKGKPKEKGKAKERGKKEGKKPTKAKPPRQLTGEGRVYVGATFNNTLVTVADGRGEAIVWVSCGRLGFKGTRKSTPYAAAATLDAALEEIKKLGMRRVKVYIKGPGPGRDAALKVLGSKREVDIISISDVTPIPHNGPRPPKKRRV